MFDAGGEAMCAKRTNGGGNKSLIFIEELLTLLCFV